MKWGENNTDSTLVRWTDIKAKAIYIFCIIAAIAIAAAAGFEWG